MFSLFHFGNNSIDSIPFIVLFLSGIILSFIYLKTNLLTATIAHAFWNFSSSVLMGGNVSGFKLKYSLFIFVHLQDDIINGGKFGIEGSIITLLILLSICLITILKNRNPTILNVQD
jgi:membrane protease YdiL (CAAX protease family)